MEYGASYACSLGNPCIGYPMGLSLGWKCSWGYYDRSLSKSYFERLH